MREYTPPPVAARTILSSPVHFVAFGFGTGLSPKAPGTVGTLAALPFWWLMHDLDLASYLTVCALLFGFGCWVCGESSRRLGVHDHGGIVFDEIVGMLVTLLPLIALQSFFDGHSRHPLMQWPALLIFFALFRFFDIVKPWPIRLLDARVKGGFGIMVDDLIAGFMAAVTFCAVFGSLFYLGAALRQFD